MLSSHQQKLIENQFWSLFHAQEPELVDNMLPLQLKLLLQTLLIKAGSCPLIAKFFAGRADVKMPEMERLVNN